MDHACPENGKFWDGLRYVNPFLGEVKMMEIKAHFFLNDDCADGPAFISNEFVRESLKKTCPWQFFVPFLGWLSYLFKGQVTSN